jgi:hypothetical protein
MKAVPAMIPEVAQHRIEFLFASGLQKIRASYRKLGLGDTPNGLPVAVSSMPRFKGQAYDPKGHPPMYISLLFRF